MREYVLRLDYERGVHPVMDVFIEHPEMVARSIDVSASLDGGWRIVRVNGPAAALEALETVYLNPAICNDCTYPHPACDGTFEYDVIESSPTAKTIYKYASDVSYCHSVTFLALSHFGEGLVFDTEQRGRIYRYRILVPQNADMGGFREVLDDGLPTGVTLDVERIGESNGWNRPRLPTSEPPFEQRQALETAWQLGYYETPRQAQLEDIAGELGLPLTTLRYRLRRAEAWALEHVIDAIATPAGRAVVTPDP